MQCISRRRHHCLNQWFLPISWLFILYTRKRFHHVHSDNKVCMFAFPYHCCCSMYHMIVFVLEDAGHLFVVKPNRPPASILNAGRVLLLCGTSDLFVHSCDICYRSVLPFSDTESLHNQASCSVPMDRSLL